MNSVFELLEHLIVAEKLNYLSKAFAKFLHEQHQNESPIVILSSAFVSYQLAQGKVYLDLNEFFKMYETVCEQHIFEDWQMAFENSQIISNSVGNSPLVWDKENNRLYLRRYWENQKTIDELIESRVKSIRKELPIEITTQLNVLFEHSNQKPDWQKIACAVALRSRFAIITGGPGTGKTTTLTKLLALAILLFTHENNGNYPVILLAAPTGKAANRVSESINKALKELENKIAEAIKNRIPTKARTIHRLLGSRPNTRFYQHHQKNQLVADIVIIDEASMIDLEMMAALLNALSDSTQLILLGDKDQLSSVEPGYVFGNLCKNADKNYYNTDTIRWINTYSGNNLTQKNAGSAINQQTVMLQHSYRFGEKSGIGQLAKKINASCKIDECTSLFSDFADLDNIETEFDLKKAICTKNASKINYAHYLAEIAKRPENIYEYDAWALKVLNAFDCFRVLSPIKQGNLGVESLNQLIQMWLFQSNLPIWYEGRPVMITSNDYNLNLMNGDIGITLKNQYGKLQVVFFNSENGVKWISPLRLSEVDTAFAMTVHKSQGSEFNHTLLVLPATENVFLSKELVYTAITRAKTHFTLFNS